MVDTITFKWLMLVALSTTAATVLPYDEAADAPAQVAAGMQQAERAGKQLLLAFGANWCPDCRVLDAAMQEPPLADLIAEHFVVVKVDVGNWDKNLAVVKAWGNPIGKGIPAIVVADPDGGIIYMTRAGELANARHMGSAALAQFFAALIDGDD